MDSISSLSYITATSSAQVCIDYNAKAVAFMERGQHTEAVNALKVALLGLRTEPQTQTSAAPLTPLVSSAPEPAPAPAPAPVPTPPAFPVVVPVSGDKAAPPSSVTPAHANDAHNEDATMAFESEAALSDEIYSVALMTAEDAHALAPDNLFSLYPRAFVVRQDRATISDSRLLVVVLYNLALLTHVRVMIKRPHDDAALQHVRSLYRNAMQTIYTTWTQEDGEDMLLLLLALACNTGHINSQRLDFAATRESLSLLLRLTATTSAQETLQPEDFEVFFESVCIFLEGADLCIAPAA